MWKWNILCYIILKILFPSILKPANFVYFIMRSKFKSAFNGIPNSSDVKFLSNWLLNNILCNALLHSTEFQLMFHPSTYSERHFHLCSYGCYMFYKTRGLYFLISSSTFEGKLHLYRSGLHLPLMYTKSTTGETFWGSGNTNVQHIRLSAFVFTARPKLKKENCM